jgi:superfamily I DNA and/or RNA helicase
MAVEGSMFKLLEREHENKTRQKPIRQLLEQIFELALEIKPVFLMSPLSVSTYLANKPNMFDCVIFDEASQIFACDALGSIYRGKQCIIIGDDKQMPPSNFFMAQLDDNSGTDEELEYDMESILDKAMATFETNA